MEDCPLNINIRSWIRDQKKPRHETEHGVHWITGCWTANCDSSDKENSSKITILSFCYFNIIRVDEFFENFSEHHQVNSVQVHA